MVIYKPINHKINFEDDTVRLFFEQDQARTLYIRGAIAWPEGRKEGFIIIAGQTLDTKQVWLFDEFQFITVDHWFYPENEFKREGASAFFLKCWGQYGCRTFFHGNRTLGGSQDVEIHRRYLLQAMDSPMIQPKPEFILTPYTEDEKVRDNIVQEYLQLSRLKANKNSELYKQIKSTNIDDELGVHCLRCLLAGFEAFPRMV